MMAAMVAAQPSSPSRPRSKQHQKTMSWPRDGEFSTQSFAQRVVQQQQQQQREEQEQRMRHSVDVEMSSPQQQSQDRPPPSRSGEKGQSRFQEGSMNDRVSAVPPAVFLSGEEEIAEYEKQFYPQVSPQQQQQQQKEEERKGGCGGGTVSGSGGGLFGLAPLWDGVREKLSLRSSRSSGSITSITSMMMLGRAAAAAAEKEAAPPTPVEPAAAAAAQIHPQPSSTTGYPTREEVLESYKNLQASGFFSAHAIKGTRHPLRTAASAPMTTGGGGSGGGGGGGGGGGMSFADRLAEQQRMLRSPVSFSAIAEVDSPDHRLRSQSHPPPPHPFPNNDNQGNDSSPYSSPSRRLKRPSNEISAEQETATRKLVKKLRRTDSRVSTASAAAAAAAATAPAPVHVPAPSRVSIVSVPPALEDLFRPSRPSISSSSIRLVEPSLYGGRSPPPSPTRPSLLRSKLSFAKLTKAMPGPKDPKDAKEKSRRARSVFGFPLVGLGRKSKQQQGESSRPASPALPASPTYSNFGGGPAPIDMMDAMMVDDDDAPPPPRVASSVFHGRTRHRRAGSTTSFSSAFSLPAFLTSSNGGGGGKRPTTPLMSQTQQHMDYHYPQRMRPTSRHGGNGFEQSQEQQPLKVAVPALPMPQRGSGIVYGKPVVVDIDEERRAKRESVVRMQQLQQLQQQEKNGSGSGSNRDSGLGSVRSVSGGHNGMMMGIVMTGGGGGGGR